MQPTDFCLSAKAFIVEEGKLLILRRAMETKHKPGQWELPGGRLEQGENPFNGLKREVKEETCLEIEVKEPLAVKHFVREDKQKITMIVFLCRPTSKKITLSKEHLEAKWVEVENARDFLNVFFQPEIDCYKKFFQKGV